MSDNTTPSAVEQPSSGNNHTRTILEIVGGVLALVLIVGAAGLGFATGRVTADHRGPDMDRMSQGQGPRGEFPGGPDERGRGGHGPSDHEMGYGQRGPGMMPGPMGTPTPSQPATPTPVPSN